MKKNKAPMPERPVQKKDPVRREKPEREPQNPVADRGVAPGITG